MGLYFFLSYAHGDRADDQRVERFFDDLSTEIRVLTGDDHDEIVGFRDFGSLRVGDTWPLKLIDALCRAWTFVALLSPRYVRSRLCGKEWTVFARRVTAYRAETGALAPSIIPVFWVPTELPPALADIQQRDPSFGELYQTHGLRYLMRLDHEREAAAFIGALAHRIVDVARRFPLPPLHRRPDFHTVPSVFGPPDEPAASDPPVAPAPRPGSQTVPGEWSPRNRPILKLDACDSPDQQ